MASIKRRRGKYHVVYYYFNECGVILRSFSAFSASSSGIVFCFAIVHDLLDFKCGDIKRPPTDNR